MEQSLCSIQVLSYECKVTEWTSSHFNAIYHGFSLSETVGLPSDKAWKKAPPHPPLVYLLSFNQFLYAYGIVIMLFDT